MDANKLKNAIDLAKQNPESPFASELRRRIESGSLDSDLHNAGLSQYATKPQESSMLGDLAKGAYQSVVGSLVTKPVARATEAITSLVAPGSEAAKGYELMRQEGQSQKIFGTEVPAIKQFGQGAGRQIGGEALETASYLIPYGKLAGAGKAAAGKFVGEGAAKVAGNIAAGATGGYTADVAMGLQNEGETVGEAFTPGIGTALGTAIPAAGPALRGTGRALQKAGEKAVGLGIPTSAKEARVLTAYEAKKPFFERVSAILGGTEKAPTTGAKTALKTTAGQTIPGLFGTKGMIGVQAKRAQGTLWDDLIAPALDSSDKAVDLNKYFAKVQDDIVNSTPELTRQKALLEALEAVKQDYDGVNTVSLKKLQKLKEGWAEFVPEKAYEGKSISGALNEVRNMLSSEARSTIYGELGDSVKQAYLDYGNLHGLVKMGEAARTGQKLKGGAGSFISDLLSRAVTPVATAGGQAVYRVGQGIEFIGNLGAKNIGEALGLKFPGDMLVDDLTKKSPKKGVKK